jgi:hypothetical protein
VLTVKVALLALVIAGATALAGLNIISKNPWAVFGPTPLLAPKVIG